MAAAVDALNKQKREIQHAEYWMRMIGAPYKGGGGGTGKIHALTVDAKVYYQEYNGSNNYHDMPTGLRVALATVILNRSNELLVAAMELMATQKRDLAGTAKQEYESLMQESAN